MSGVNCMNRIKRDYFMIRENEAREDFEKRIDCVFGEWELLVTDIKDQRGSLKISDFPGTGTAGKYLVLEFTATNENGVSHDLKANITIVAEDVPVYMDIDGLSKEIDDYHVNSLPQYTTDDEGGGP